MTRSAALLARVRRILIEKPPTPLRCKTGDAESWAKIYWTWRKCGDMITGDQRRVVEIFEELQNLRAVAGELAGEYEIAIAQNIALESTIHSLTKEKPAGKGETIDEMNRRRMGWDAEEEARR